jgi:hypothetical protein
MPKNMIRVKGLKLQIDSSSIMIDHYQAFDSRFFTRFDGQKPETSS